jgi:hypothetical protein
MPLQEGDWSDSDDEQLLGEVETSVLLGVPDGPIIIPSDTDDAAVSRIGGHPVRSILMYALQTILLCVHKGFSSFT